VLRGTMRFRKGLTTVIARAGDEVVVPPGSYHRFANAGKEPAMVRVEVRPALSMERLYQTVVALTRDGRTLRSGMPKPLDLALFMREFDQEVQAPLAPGLVRVATAPLAWLAARRGLQRRYPRLVGATPLGPVRPGDGRPAGVRPTRPARSRPRAAGRRAIRGRPGHGRPPARRDPGLAAGQQTRYGMPAERKVDSAATDLGAAAVVVARSPRDRSPPASRRGRSG